MSNHNLGLTEDEMRSLILWFTTKGYLKLNDNNTYTWINYSKEVTFDIFDEPVAHLLIEAIRNSMGASKEEVTYMFKKGSD